MIEITTFGGFQIAVDGQTVALSNRKSQALLVYLAINSSQQHNRAILASFFWPDLPEAAALNNLSKALLQLRKVIYQADGPELIDITRHALEMDRSASWYLDANLFAELVEQARKSANPFQSIANLEKAVLLYRGEFLAGLSLKDCPTFEGWLLLQRENLALMARDSYQEIAGHYLEHGVFETARKYAREQLALDAWHEEAHRQLMRALDGLGLRSDALAQYETCREILRSELGVEPEWATKVLYEQIKAGQEQAGSQARPVETRPPTARLPKQLLPLIGRRRELSALKSDLEDPARRMITIVGAGGVGKTSLALEAARQVAREFGDGAAFVPLDRLQPSADTDLNELLAASIGAALELTFSGIEPVQQQLYKHLGSREILLVLDNFEHLITAPGSSLSLAGKAFLVTLLERVPAVKALLTSRVRFDIPAEIILPLEGLPVPDPEASLSEIADSSSVRLFVEQARRIQRDFRLTNDNAPAVAQICRLVDGLPLGIELAARWVTHFSCSEIAAAIQEDLNFLAAGGPQLTERHQSIRATFSYSWRMLAAEEQQLLARLSIILGQFSRDAALTIAADSLGTLVRLQGKSLLRQERPGHYSLHQLLRQFAAEKLEAQPAGELDALRRRYCDYYLQMLADQGQGFNQGWTGEAIKEIAQNIDNIRSAWQWALELGYFDLLDRALQALYHYYRIQGLFHEARHLFGQAAAAFKSLHNQDPENRPVEQLLGRALVRQGRLAWFLADTWQSSLLLQEGLEHLQKANASTDIPRCYAYMGENALRLGRIAEAGSLLDKALSLYRQEGDQHGTAFTLELKATQASLAGDLAEADRLFEESIATSRRSGNRRLEGRGLHDWGMILIQQGRVEQAAALLRNSLDIAMELDLHMPVAFNQSMLARTDRHAGNYDHARQRLISSLAVLEGSGYTAYTLAALNMLGEVLAILSEDRHDQTDEARNSLEKALAQLNEMQPTDSDAYRQLALDFLVASAYLFAHTGRDQLAGRYLSFVLKRAGRDTDISMRVQQLSIHLSSMNLKQDSLSTAPLADETTLPEVIGQFLF